MAFGRKKNKDDEPEVEAKGAKAAKPLKGKDGKPLPEPLPEPEPIPKTTGPYDSADVEDEAPRLDLGGIRVPVPEGTEIRVDVSPEGQVMSAVAVNGQSQLQVNAFAAPRREGIWDDVRAEILQSLRNEQGGQAEEADGPFGRELRAGIPTGQPGQFTPARFIGVDGPRWFLRGLMTGPAALDPAAARPLEEIFRGVVVVRGNEAMAPRDTLPLKLPREAQEAAAAQAAAAHEAAGGDPGRYESGDFNPFERGPEITETR